MAITKKSTALLRNPNILNAKFKDRFASAGMPRISADQASSVLTAYDPAKWLLSHVTIVASVDVERANPLDEKSNYYISPFHEEFVNNNGDSWSRGILSKTYKTFLGASNYIEHIQKVEFSKGKIVDVALREIDLGRKNAKGVPQTTLYTDILVATSREHKEIVDMIESGELNAMSMGCFVYGTPVIMADGTLKPINQVMPGDYVLDHKGDKQRVKYLEIKKRLEGHKNGYILETTSGKISVTEEHPFLVQGEFVQAKDLSVGQSIESPIAQNSAAIPDMEAALGALAFASTITQKGNDLEFVLPALPKRGAEELRVKILMGILSKCNGKTAIMGYAKKIIIKNTRMTPNQASGILPTDFLLWNTQAISLFMDILKGIAPTLSATEEQVQILQIALAKIGGVLYSDDSGIEIALNQATPCTSKILSITPVELEEDVFNLEVEESHTYQVLGMAVHNCTIQYSICSQCGNLAHDETEMCHHILYEKGHHFYDNYGVRRVVAELCGHEDDPDSVKFVEASWVRNPAFPGAVLRGIVSPGIGYVPMSLPNREAGAPPVKDGITDYLQNQMVEGNILHTPHHEVGIINKAASTKKKADDSLFPEDSSPETTPEDLFGDDTSSADPSSEGDSGDSGDSFGGEDSGDSFGGEDSGDGSGGGEAPTPPSPAETAAQFLTSIPNEMIEQFMGRLKQDMTGWYRDQVFPSGTGPGRGGANPYMYENDVNDNLIRVASSPDTYRALVSKYAVNLMAMPIRVASVMAAASTVGSFHQLSRMGAHRRDIVATLAFLHNATSPEEANVGQDVTRYVSSNTMEGMSPKGYVLAMGLNTGRKLTAHELVKAAEWVQLLEA